MWSEFFLIELILNYAQQCISIYNMVFGQPHRKPTTTISRDMSHIKLVAAKKNRNTFTHFSHRSSAVCGALNYRAHTPTERINDASGERLWNKHHRARTAEHAHMSH